MDPEIVTVRRLSSEIIEPSKDWNAIYDLCCRTGNNGQPIAGERWDFFGRLWVEPYKSFVPQWTYVAEAKQIIVGYLTGCPDTSAFTKVKFWKFTLPLLVDVFRGRYRRNRDARRFVRQIFGLERIPERVFPRGLVRKLRQDYPAHLHMNVETGWRSSGIGAKLVGQFFADLRGVGIPGVHLYCGVAPLEFYRRQGFKDPAKVCFRGMPVYALVLRLRD